MSTPRQTREHANNNREVRLVNENLRLGEGFSTPM